MVNTSGAAVLPKEAFFFGPKRHMFRFGQLNAFTAQIRGNKIDFFLWWKVSWHVISTIFIFTLCCIYMWARLYRKKHTF
jgi:hypothetical protein